MRLISFSVHLSAIKQRKSPHATFLRAAVTPGSARLGSAGGVTSSLLTAAFVARHCTQTHTHTERGSSHEVSSRRMHLIALLLRAVNASSPFSPFSRFLLLLLFSLKIICSQRRAVASPPSAPFVGNWLQKWRLAFRSDTVWAICSVSGEGRLGRTEECDRPSV